MTRTMEQANAASEPCGRYAPTPSGRLHLGNLRTALLAWLWARSLGGRFVMRVEDLDRGRCRADYERDQLADLQWLGLEWDEGPYRQSERESAYEAALARLSVFRCTCTRKDLRRTARARHGREPVYPGTCRARHRPIDGPGALRWRVPPGSIEFHDRVCGPQRQEVAAEVGDFIVRRADGVFAYQLAVVADDAAMGVTHVLRGADLLESTARQISLQRALDFPTPDYAHVPLVLGADGDKLGKRHGAPDLTRLREQKADPERIIAFLARSMGLVGPSVARLRPSALVADFDISSLRSDDQRIEIDEMPLAF